MKGRISLEGPSLLAGIMMFERISAFRALSVLLFLLCIPARSACGATEVTEAGSPRADLALGILLAPGTKVRVDAPGRLSSRLVGTVVALRSDTLEVTGRVGTLAAKPARWTGLVPLSAIDNLERNYGSKGHALVGMGIGFVVGAVIGKETYDSNCSDCTWGDLQAVMFGLVGVIPGGIIGAQFRTQLWEKVQVGPLGFGMPAAHGGEFRLSVTL